MHLSGVIFMSIINSSILITGIITGHCCSAVPSNTIRLSCDTTDNFDIAHNERNRQKKEARDEGLLEQRKQINGEHNGRKPAPKKVPYVCM